MKSRLNTFRPGWKIPCLPDSCLASHNWTVKLRRDASCQTMKQGQGQCQDQDQGCLTTNTSRSRLVAPSLLPDSRRSRHQPDPPGLQRSRSLGPGWRCPAPRPVTQGGSLRLPRPSTRQQRTGSRQQTAPDSRQKTVADKRQESKLESKPDSLLCKLFSRRKEEKRVFAGQFPPAPAKRSESDCSEAGRRSLSQQHRRQVQFAGPPRGPGRPLRSPPARRPRKYSSLSSATPSSGEESGDSAALR